MVFGCGTVERGVYQATGCLLLKDLIIDRFHSLNSANSLILKEVWMCVVGTRKGRKDQRGGQPREECTKATGCLLLVDLILYFERKDERGYKRRREGARIMKVGNQTFFLEERYGCRFPILKLCDFFLFLKGGWMDVRAWVQEKGKEGRKEQEQ